ncbi:MAG: EAL domain-containing protein [Nitrospirae bacterium]|nr:EAL domain-containing protein [Candidatus Manganitrophaceae bacterium]
MKIDRQQFYLFLQKTVFLFLLSGITLGLLYDDSLKRWDNLFYDGLIRLMGRPAPEDIVMIGIDDLSLNELGRWPWSRRRHAKLIDVLSGAGAKVIGFDILFSEADAADPEGDRLFAAAMRKSKRVVLPVASERLSAIGITEILPLPMFTEAATALGHVEISLDGDGIQRGLFLKAGLSTAHWFAFSVSILQQSEGFSFPSILEETKVGSPYTWTGAYPVLISFSGPPGHFKEIAYADVIAGRISSEQIRDKTILVGMTASGLSPRISTPVSGESQQMSGVELHANILHALRSGLHFQRIGFIAHLLITLLLVLSPVAFYYYFSPRAAFAATCIVVLMTLTLSGLSLSVFNLWVPPAVSLVVVSLSAPLLSWIRLEGAAQALSHEKERAQVTLHSIGDAVITTDADGIVDYMNPVAETLTGYTFSLASGRPFNAVFHAIDETTGERVSYPVTECISSDNLLRLPESILLLSASGQEYILHVSVKPIYGETRMALGIAVAFSNVTYVRQVAQKLEFQATHDALTQLPNRYLLFDRLKHAIRKAQRHQKQVALLFLDLDDFKKVNDGYGHTMGDLLLIKVVERLRISGRAEDTIARLGGDEFVLVLENLSGETVIATVAQKILDALKAPFILDNHDFFVGGSMGISLYPKDGDDPETLLKNADTAMYRAKEAGKNRFQFYTKDMNSRVVKRLLMEEDLRRAIKEGELQAYYQLLVGVVEKQVTGVECLLRWKHPKRGLISPAEFIPLAEETGLIIPIGEWVMRTACKQARHWRYLGFPISRVAVNLSPRQFLQKDLTETVARILEETKLPAHCLGLEITEGMIMKNVEGSVETLKSLKKMGVHLAIDDFGTGYSSLSYLKSFPIDHLKIDQSFVRDITTNANDAAISQAIIAMAHSMKLYVTAEGVETEAQAEFLKLNGCDEMQGFHYCRPVPHEEITQMLMMGGASRFM